MLPLPEKWNRLSGIAGVPRASLELPVGPEWLTRTFLAQFLTGRFQFSVEVRRETLRKTSPAVPLWGTVWLCDILDLCDSLNLAHNIKEMWVRYINPIFHRGILYEECIWMTYLKLHSISLERLGENIGKENSLRIPRSQQYIQAIFTYMSVSTIQLYECIYSYNIWVYLLYKPTLTHFIMSGRSRKQSQ